MSLEEKKDLATHREKVYVKMRTDLIDAAISQGMAKLC
jgi:hypothetical protein